MLEMLWFQVVHYNYTLPVGEVPLALVAEEHAYAHACNEHHLQCRVVVHQYCGHPSLREVSSRPAHQVGAFQPAHATAVQTTVVGGVVVPFREQMLLGRALALFSFFAADGSAIASKVRLAGVLHVHDAVHDGHVSASEFEHNNFPGLNRG